MLSTSERARIRTALEDVANLTQQLLFPGAFRRRDGHRRSGLLLQAAHHFHDDENAEGDNGEVDHRIDERAVGDDGGSGFLRLSEGSGFVPSGFPQPTAI